jgi:hypothetical protein
MILQPNWETQPGDGTGSSIADGKVRNQKGICAIQGCGKPMNKRNNMTVFGCFVCDACCQSWKKAVYEN